MQLDEENSRLITFTISFGQYRWNVLQFVITPKPEIFQKVVYDTISDLELVFGRRKTMKEDTSDHDRKLL